MSFSTQGVPGILITACPCEKHTQNGNFSHIRYSIWITFYLPRKQLCAFSSWHWTGDGQLPLLAQLSNHHHCAPATVGPRRRVWHQHNIYRDAAQPLKVVGNFLLDFIVQAVMTARQLELTRRVQRSRRFSFTYLSFGFEQVPWTLSFKSGLQICTYPTVAIQFDLFVNLGGKNSKFL